MKRTRKSLMKCIDELSKISYLFSTNPSKDFSRNRKLSFKRMITSLLCMKGGSLSNELLDLFDNKVNMPSASAFVQQRAKILFYHNQKISTISKIAYTQKRGFSSSFL